jgi:tRNA pseudouridine55 synthase
MRGLESGLSGWLVIDKPPGVTSSRAVEIVRRAAGAKAGHAGTLDPLATGVLPIALGEATKTVAYAAQTRKLYRFRLRWGVARATDDTEGAVTGETAVRPDAAAVEAMLPRFTGTILQVPPAYSALKIAGRRAYALARRDEPVALAARPVEILALRLLDLPDRDHAVLEALVGKGTYIRALARDLAASLETLAHIVELRRLSVGRFCEAQAISLDLLAAIGHNIRGSGHLLPIETVLDDIPAFALTAAEAVRMRHGQTVTLLDPDECMRLSQLDGAVVSARHADALIGIARIERGSLRPVRIINP